MRISSLCLIAPLALAAAACGGTGGGSESGTATDEGSQQVAEASTGASGRPDVFLMCASCHQVEPGRHAVGPSLAGVFGAKAGHAQGYAYSPAMKDSGLTWDEATLDKYLESPRETVPGTKMAYAGMKNPQQREQLIAYLKGL